MYYVEINIHLLYMGYSATKNSEKPAHELPTFSLRKLRAAITTLRQKPFVNR
jgi:hypothetical protein